MTPRMDKTAMALQWAIHSFMPESRALGTEPSNAALSLGLEVASNILLPLTAELALKGLKQKEASLDSYERTHDLLCLFRSLSDDTQNQLAMQFRKYMEDDPRTRDRNANLEDFLEKHRDDFVQWRYLEGDVDSLEPARIEFHYVICAALDLVYSGE